VKPLFESTVIVLLVVAAMGLAVTIGAAIARAWP
jgi:hypothetical protein